MAEKSNPELVPNDGAISDTVARLSSAVSHSSAICFAIVDEDLHFRAVNEVLAATYGVSVEAHIGSNMHDIIGELAVQAGPALQRVLRSDHELYFETLGKLPNRTYAGCWVNHVFPVETPKGKVQQVGVLAVEVTELRSLGELYTNLTSQSLPGATVNESALARDLHTCIGEYKMAIGMNLASVGSSTHDPEGTIESFTHSMIPCGCSTSA